MSIRAVAGAPAGSRGADQHVDVPACHDLSDSLAESGLGGGVLVAELDRDVQEPVVHAADDDARLGAVGQRARGLPEPGHGLHEEAPSPSLEDLEVVEPTIQPSGGEEVAVRAALDDAPRLEDDELVRPPDGRKAVRDHERRAARHQALEGLLDGPLALGVEGRGRLVEDRGSAGP